MIEAGSKVGSAASAEMPSGPKLRLLGRLVGLGFALLGLAALIELWWHELAVWDESGPGPSFAPGVLSAMLVVLGLILASGLFPHTLDEEDDDDGEDRPGPMSMVKFTLLLAALIVLFPYLGGVVALSLFVTVEMLWVERNTMLAAIVSGIVAFALIWIVFIQILAVPLPAGWLVSLG